MTRPPFPILTLYQRLFFQLILCCLPLLSSAQMETDRRHPYRFGGAFAFTSQEQAAVTVLGEAPLGKAFSLLGEAGGFHTRYLSLWRENPAQDPSYYEGRAVLHGQFRYFPLYKRVGIQKAFVALLAGYERNHLSYVLSGQPRDLQRVFQVGAGAGWLQSLGKLFYLEGQVVAGPSLIQNRHWDSAWSNRVQSQSSGSRFEICLRLAIGLQVFDTP